MVRKPRQLYTDQESAKLDAAAQQTFERIAGGIMPGDGGVDVLARRGRRITGRNQ